MFMLRSYMDESGHSEDPNLHFAGMAGFVARWDQWEIFAPRWIDTLKNAGLKKPFHMKDFANFQGEFAEGWRSENDLKRKALLGRLLELIVETRAVPVGHIVSLEGFRSLTEAQQSGFAKNPYFISFQHCTRGAAVQGIGYPADEKVAMVYAYNHEFGTVTAPEPYSVDQAGMAAKLWHEMQQSTDFGQWMGSYASGSPVDCVQLQAADIFAYELTKEFENRIRRPSDDMRFALRKILTLVKSRLPFIRLFDRKELLRVIRENGWPDQAGVEELDVMENVSAMEHMWRWLNERGRKFCS